MPIDSGPMAPIDSNRGESWDAWRARVDATLAVLVDGNKLLQKIYRAVAGGADDDEIGLREGHRDHERRLEALETRANAHAEKIRALEKAPGQEAIESAQEVRQHRRAAWQHSIGSIVGVIATAILAAIATAWELAKSRIMTGGMH